MKLPQYCYQKAFWILLSVFVTVVISTTGLIYGQIIGDIAENTLQSRANEIKIKELEQQTRQLDNIYRNQILICIQLEVSCK